MYIMSTYIHTYKLKQALAALYDLVVRSCIFPQNVIKQYHVAMYINLDITF